MKQQALSLLFCFCLASLQACGGGSSSSDNKATAHHIDAYIEDETGELLRTIDIILSHDSRVNRTQKKTPNFDGQVRFQDLPAGDSYSIYPDLKPEQGTTTPEGVSYVDLSKAESIKFVYHPAPPKPEYTCDVTFTYFNSGQPAAEIELHTTIRGNVVRIVTNKNGKYVITNKEGSDPFPIYSYEQQYVLNPESVTCHFQSDQVLSVTVQD